MKVSLPAALAMVTIAAGAAGAQETYEGLCYWDPGYGDGGEAYACTLMSVEHGFSAISAEGYELMVTMYGPDLASIQEFFGGTSGEDFGQFNRDPQDARCWNAQGGAQVFCAQ
jgi:hypothetical protein